MPEPIRVSRVRLSPAGPDSHPSGMYGWLSFELNGVLVLDGATLRRTADGQYCVSYPVHRDGRGRDHHLVRPVDDEVRREIERQILEALGLQAEAAP